MEASDAERQHPAKWRDARCVVAAGSKPQGRAADEHDSRESAKATGEKEERKLHHDNEECFVHGKQGHKQWDCPQIQQGRVGKDIHGQSHSHSPMQQQQSTSGPAQGITGARYPG